MQSSSALSHINCFATTYGPYRLINAYPTRRARIVVTQRPPAPAQEEAAPGIQAPESSRLGSGLQRAESALRRAEHICGIIGLRALGEWRRDRRQRQVRQQSSCAAESSGAPEAASFSRPNNFAISSTRASTSPCEPVRTMIAAIMAVLVFVGGANACHHNAETAEQTSTEAPQKADEKTQSKA